MGRKKTPWAAEAPKADPNAIFNFLVKEILSDPVKREAARKQINGELARISFAHFVKEAWHVVEPSTVLDWNWHHQLICDTMQAMFHAWRDARTQKGKRVNIFQGLPKNAVFNLPPGSLKSRIISVCYPVWCWIHEPGMRFICLSVNEDASMRDGRMSRELIRSEWYQSTFKPKWTLNTDQTAVSNYGNSMSGERLSRASGSEIVGLRGDCLGAASKILTEIGEVEIEILHLAALNGIPLPRVYAHNPKNGKMELRSIQATRRLKSSKTRTIRTETGAVLTCTDGHRFNTGTEYKRAEDCTSVSVLPRADQTIASKQTSALRELQDSNANVSAMSNGFPAFGGRARQESKASTATVLQQELFGAQSQGGENYKLRVLRKAFPALFQQGDPSNLLAKLWERAKGKGESAEDTAGQALSLLPADDGNTLGQNDVLRQNLCGSPSLNSDGGIAKSALQELAELRWGTLGEIVRIGKNEGRSSLHSVWGTEQFEKETDSTPYRSYSNEQRSGESDYAVRSLPYDTSQIQGTTVLSNDETVERGRGEEIYVYDLQVEGLHNFVANSISCHNCLLIDDPNNPKEAENKVERLKVMELWNTNIYNRVNDSRCSMRIGVQQRVNTDDWTGSVIKTQGLWSPDNEFGWLHIVLPAEYESDRRYVMPDCLAKYCTWPGAVLSDPRKVEGESIHPVRFTDAFLKAERERWKYSGQYAGQMQQRPALLEGTLVKRPWWGWFRLAEGVRDDIAHGHHPRPAMCHDGAPMTIHRKPYKEDEWDFDWITISVDPAAKKTEKGSQYGLLCIAGKGGRRFILDDRTQRGAFHEILEIIKDMIMTWRPDSILIEPKAAGPDLMDTLREQMYAGDLPMVAIEEADPGNTDKESRLQATIPTLVNGAVLLLDGAPWTAEFVEELSTFPNGSNDDRVDAFSQCLNNKRPVDDDLPDW